MTEIENRLDEIERKLDKMEDKIIDQLDMIHSLIVALNEKAIDNL
jgi:hypothetical protein